MRLLSNFFANVKNVIKGEIQAKDIRRKVFLAILVITMMLITIGSITNIILGMSFWATATTVIALFVAIFLFIKGRTTDNLEFYIKIFLVLALILIAASWFANAGYDSNLIILICTYFVVFLSLFEKKDRVKLLIVFILFSITLATIQVLDENNQWVIGYSDKYRRYFDWISGGSMYFVALFFIHRLIYNAFESEKQQLEESKIKYQDLYDTMPIGYYKTTNAGRFIEANPMMVKMLGYGSFDEIKDLDIITTFYFDADERESVLLNNLEFSDEVEVYKLKKKDGSGIWLEDHPRYIRDEQGNVIIHEGLCKDITMRMEHEQKLIQNEVKLEELNAAKDKFFSIIAHDLKNPIGSIKDISNILYIEYDELPEEDKKEFLEVVASSTQNVYSLLENLLEWSRTQRELIRYEPNYESLDLIVNKIHEIYNGNLLNKHLTFISNYKSGIQIYTDLNLVYTILRNLVSNAIKFTPEHGSIEVGAILEDDTNKQLTMYVKDSGVGMPKEKVEKVFNLNNNTSTDGTSGEKGTGLGLILVKEFVNINKGRIWIESEVGKGTTIFFTVPLVPDDENKDKV